MALWAFSCVVFLGFFGDGVVLFLVFCFGFFFIEMEILLSESLKHMNSQVLFLIGIFT